MRCAHARTHAQADALMRTRIHARLHAQSTNTPHARTLAQTRARINAPTTLRPCLMLYHCLHVHSPPPCTRWTWVRGVKYALSRPRVNVPCSPPGSMPQIRVVTSPHARAPGRDPETRRPTGPSRIGRSRVGRSRVGRSARIAAGHPGPAIKGSIQFILSPILHRPTGSPPRGTTVTSPCHIPVVMRTPSGPVPPVHLNSVPPPHLLRRRPLALWSSMPARCRRPAPQLLCNWSNAE